MPTYILVHGAWGGAWCWRDVGAEMDRRGVAWRAVDLPSSRVGADARDRSRRGRRGGRGTRRRQWAVCVSSPTVTAARSCPRSPRASPTSNVASTSPHSSRRRARARTMRPSAFTSAHSWMTPSKSTAATSGNPEAAIAAFYSDCAPDVATMGRRPTLHPDPGELSKPTRVRQRPYRDHLRSLHERSRHRSADPTTHVRRVRLRAGPGERALAASSLSPQDSATPSSTEPRGRTCETFGMSENQWSEVDEYLVGQLLRSNIALDEALREARRRICRR